MKPNVREILKKYDNTSNKRKHVTTDECMSLLDDLNDISDIAR